MLSWSITFFFIAIVAGIFGFTSIAISAVSIGKLLFFVFVLLFIVSIIAPKLRRQLI